MTIRTSRPEYATGYVTAVISSVDTEQASKVYLEVIRYETRSENSVGELPKILQSGNNSITVDNYIILCDREQTPKTPAVGDFIEFEIVSNSLTKNLKCDGYYKRVIVKTKGEVDTTSGGVLQSIKDAFNGLANQLTGEQLEPEQAKTESTDVVQIANSINGGGYYWETGVKDTGVPTAINFKGKILLNKGIKTYCSGFTFWVVFTALINRKMLESLSRQDMIDFQQIWYGARTSSKNFPGTALSKYKLGSSVTLDSASKGDFIQFFRKNGPGHSAIFLEWVEKDNKKAGFKYRSTQSSTNGVGDRVEYFSDSGGSVLRNQTFVGRIKG